MVPLRWRLMSTCSVVRKFSSDAVSSALDSKGSAAALRTRDRRRRRAESRSASEPFRESRRNFLKTLSILRIQFLFCQSLEESKQTKRRPDRFTASIVLSRNQYFRASSRHTDSIRARLTAFPGIHPEVQSSSLHPPTV